MKFNNETLRAAVKEWLDDESKAEKKYGHISDWDTSEVTDMSEMFARAESFNQPLEKWDVSQVTKMSDMFFAAKSFNQPLEKWDVSKVTDKAGTYNIIRGKNKSNDYTIFIPEETVGVANGHYEIWDRDSKGSEFYEEGQLVFEDNELIDYDGTAVLSESIINEIGKVRKITF